MGRLQEFRLPPRVAIGLFVARTAPLVTQVEIEHAAIWDGRWLKPSAALLLRCCQVAQMSPVPRCLHSIVLRLLSTCLRHWLAGTVHMFRSSVSSPVLLSCLATCVMRLLVCCCVVCGLPLRSRSRVKLGRATT